MAELVSARGVGSIDVYCAGRNKIRATAPMYRGQPGYRIGMDGGDDGIACQRTWED